MNKYAEAKKKGKDSVAGSDPPSDSPPPEEEEEEDSKAPMPVTLGD